MGKSLITERTQGEKPALRQLESLAQSLATLRETYPNEPDIPILQGDVQDLTDDIRGRRGPPGGGPPGPGPRGVGPPGPRPPPGRPPVD